ncbi:hypothetical protein FIBSPDRAFT_439685 [Athelia psychrophila]|uniref:Uncharacterized protein n=1 Tax=Athelia psychrophila TaxID=1759441 RepID=A0A166MDV0_9AGAM|nr:hypothetical protein FIBSPDRAFT_439685 [Fibularhizoctonia sp. CBS 109695]
MFPFISITSFVSLLISSVSFITSSSSLPLSLLSLPLPLCLLAYQCSLLVRRPGDAGDLGGKYLVNLAHCCHTNRFYFLALREGHESEHRGKWGSRATTLLGPLANRFKLLYNMAPYFARLALLLITHLPPQPHIHYPKATHVYSYCQEWGSWVSATCSDEPLIGVLLGRICSITHLPLNHIHYPKATHV